MKPDYLVTTLTDIKASEIKSLGIHLCICDVDNTLCCHDESCVDETKKQWINSFKEEGIQVVLISNNHKKRIAKIGEQLGCDTIGFALKPTKRAYKQIVKHYHVSPHEVFCIGDQLFTDIIGAKRMHMKCALVEPIAKKDIIYTKFTRGIENLIIRKWRKKDE